MSLGDMLSDVGSFIEDNPWALALAATPIMGAGVFGSGVAATNASAGTAATLAGADAAFGGLGAAGIMPGELAGMATTPLSQMGAGAFLSPEMAISPMPSATAKMMGAANANVKMGAVPNNLSGAISGGIPAAAGMNPMKAMQMAALSGGGQQQRPGMPSAPRPRPMNPQAVQSFMKYAPMGIPMNQGMNTAGRFGLLTGNKYGFGR